MSFKINSNDGIDKNKTCSVHYTKGPGIFRSSDKDLIALKTGGFLLYPVQGHLVEHSFQEAMSLFYQESHLLKTVSTRNYSQERTISEQNKNFLQPEITSMSLSEPQYKPFEIAHDAVFTLRHFSFKHVPEYEWALLKHGFALIRANFRDINHIFFKQLIRHLGVPVPHNSQRNTDLWHIKGDTQSGRSNQARSLTKCAFRMHTDASFNTNPPRYLIYRAKTYV